MIETIINRASQVTAIEFMYMTLIFIAVAFFAVFASGLAYLVKVDKRIDKNLEQAETLTKRLG